MANSPQSKKRARQNEARFQVNKARRSRIRTFLRKVEEAIESGDKEAAANALKAAQPELMRGVTKGVFHKNTASRKVSRLASRVKATQRFFFENSESRLKFSCRGTHEIATSVERFISPWGDRP